ncbi:MAG: SusC/RagA family TonB-linked outer membrane protein [Bacteroidales bacterium]|nr:SusC/RagA family TonB-linked outer membrane protein [Bacteroidales bacterium]
MKKILTLALIVAACISFSAAQEKIVTGLVTSAEDGNPIPGVTVMVVGTNAGVTTNMDGQYNIKVPPDGLTLQFSFIGMKTLEIPIQGRSTIDVVMETEFVEMDEVIVTALGIKKEKKALNYSTQSVKNETLTMTAQPNITNALQGKVAGVSIIQSSGMPGSSSYITIRGATSLDGNNQPLYVVDGMPVFSDAIFTEPDNVNRVTNSDASSRALDINPSDIESIEVLKGPVASALYGLKAGNGVILITTKSGKGLKAGQGIVSYSTSVTTDIVTRYPELQSTYAQGADGVFQQGTSRSYGPRIEDVGDYVNIWGDSVHGQRYDNVSPFFRNGITYTNDLGFTKAGENYNLYASVGYTTQKGVIPKTGMQRFTGRITGEYKVSKRLTAGGSAMYTNMNVTKIPNGSNLSNPLFTVYYAPRSFDMWNNPYAHEDDPYNQYHYRAAMDNPRWSLANNDFKESNDRIIGNTHFEYKPWDFLTIRYQIGVDFVTNNQKEVYELGSGETGGRTDPPSGGKITDFSYFTRAWNSNATITFDKKFGNFGVNFIIGQEIDDTYAREITMYGEGFLIGGYHNMANAESQRPFENIYAMRTAGIYSSMTLSFKSILFLTGTAREDRVSNLARGNRDFFYPSVGGSFVFSELMPGISDIFTFGKLRASYAMVGQAYGSAYATRNVYVTSSTGYGGFLQDGIQFPFNSTTSFQHYYVLFSEDLKPQNTKTVEVGIDLRFIHGRIGLDYTFFHSNVEDQIFQVPISPSSGYRFELRNAGVLKSVGHEATLTLVPVKTTSFTWTIEANFTKYTNTVEELAPGVTDIYLGGFTTPSIRALKGETYPSIYGIGYVRDDQGRIVVLDQPGNPYHGMPLATSEATKIGDVQPDFLIGFNSTFTYKGIQLTALVDWKSGGEMYSGNNMLGELYGALKITEDRETPVVLEGAKGYFDADGELVITGNNDIAIYRNQNYWDRTLNPLDEAHVHETSYVRFRELSIGYAMPAEWFNNIFIKSIAMSLVGRNLALWTSYPNFDPETSTTGAVNGQGIEYVAFPQIASFGGKLSITF